MTHSIQTGSHDSRERGKVLGAATVADVMVRNSLLSVLQIMVGPQIKQMQRVLDAAVIDPLVYDEANALYKRSQKVYGQLVVVDPVLRRKSEHVMRDYVVITDADKRIRIDYKRLLARDAFDAVTDNPDEVDYMAKVRATLEKQGVWLRFSSKLVRNRDDTSRWVNDPLQWEAWLSLGPTGDRIPTYGGRIDRKALLETTLFGAGFYRSVHEGAIQTALKKEMEHLSVEIASGLEQHNEIARIRRNTTVGVVEVSDLLGGADFPSNSIWDQPHRLLLKALELNIGGRVYGSQAYLLVAAVMTRNAARLLASYIDDTGSGAGRAVKVLKVARTAGKVAEVGLAVTGVVGFVRANVTIVVGGGADAAVDVAVKRAVNRYAASVGTDAELSQLKWEMAPGQAGTKLGNVRGGHSSGYGGDFRSY